MNKVEFEKHCVVLRNFNSNPLNHFWRICAIGQLDGSQDILANNNFDKNGVVSGKGWIVVQGKEKLAAVSVRSRICHRQLAKSVEAQSVIQLINELISRTTTASTRRVSTLGYKVVNDTVKGYPVIKTIFCKVHEVVYCDW